MSENYALRNAERNCRLVFGFFIHILRMHAARRLVLLLYINYVWCNMQRQSQSVENGKMTLVRSWHWTSKNYCVDIPFANNNSRWHCTDPVLSIAFPIDWSLQWVCSSWHCRFCDRLNSLQSAFHVNLRTASMTRKWDLNLLDCSFDCLTHVAPRFADGLKLFDCISCIRWPTMTATMTIK